MKIPSAGSQRCLGRLGSPWLIISGKLLPQLKLEARGGPKTSYLWGTLKKKKKATFFQLSQSSERHLERKGFYNMNMSSDVSNPTSTPKLLKYLWVKLTHKNLLLTEKNKQRGTILHGSYLVTFFLM